MQVQLKKWFRTPEIKKEKKGKGGRPAKKGPEPKVDDCKDDEAGLAKVMFEDTYTCATAMEDYKDVEGGICANELFQPYCCRSCATLKAKMAVSRQISGPRSGPKGAEEKGEETGDGQQRPEGKPEECKPEEGKPAEGGSPCAELPEARLKQLENAAKKKGQNAVTEGACKKALMAIRKKAAQSGGAKEEGGGAEEAKKVENCPEIGYLSGRWMGKGANPRKPFDTPGMKKVGKGNVYRLAEETDEGRRRLEEEQTACQALRTTSPEVVKGMLAKMSPRQKKKQKGKLTEAQCEAALKKMEGGAGDDKGDKPENKPEKEPNCTTKEKWSEEKTEARRRREGRRFLHLPTPLRY